MNCSFLAQTDTNSKSMNLHTNTAHVNVLALRNVFCGMQNDERIYEVNIRGPDWCRQSVCPLTNHTSAERR